MDGITQASHEIVSHNYAPFNAAVAKYVEKLEQPDPRIASQAFREKARGVGHVLKALGIAALLTLIGASLVVLCQQRAANTLTEDNAITWPVPTSPDPPDVVIDYTLFATVPVTETLDVVTGWRFAKSTDKKPNYQYCYLRTPENFGSRTINVAARSESEQLIKQASPSTFSGVVLQIDYETALAKCRWFTE